MKKPTRAKPPKTVDAAAPTFDLREESWIPVVDRSGTLGELSLRGVLRDAPRLLEIRDPLPTAEFGLYRLLVALVLDIFELRSAGDLESLLGAGEFRAARVDAYFEKWHDRFDLFHAKYPFLQTPGMKDEKAKPLAGLIHPLPSGTNASHFHHGGEEAFGVCPAVAARLLTTIAPFMTAGGAGLSPSLNGAPPWYALVCGRTLFETLCLNCAVLSDLLPQAKGDEPPAWHSKRAVNATRRPNASLPESLTWRPRRIELLPDGSGFCAFTRREMPVLVRKMRFCAGFGAGFEWTDPNVSYRITDKGRNVLRPQEGWAVWRDTGPIALLRADKYQSENGKVRFDRPAIVSQFAYLHERDMLKTPLPLDLTLYGMRTDLKMKVFEWHRERLSLPAPLLWKTQFHSVAQQEMDRAGGVEYAMGQAIKKAYPREGAGNKAAFKALITRAQNEFWTLLRPHYDALLNELAVLPEDDMTKLAKCLANWRNALKDVAKAAVHAALDDLDTDSDALERQTAALRAFDSALFFRLNPEAAARARANKGRKTPQEAKQ